MQQHSDKMSKWAAESTEALGDPIFCILLRVAVILLQPLQHFMNLVKKRRSKDEPQNLACLVWGKARDILAEIVALQNSVDLFELFEEAPISYMNTLQRCVTKMCLELQAGFTWRIIDSVEAIHVSMLWFAYGSAGAECQERVDLCRKLLSPLDGSRLHASCRKSFLFSRPNCDTSSTTTAPSR